MTDQEKPNEERARLAKEKEQEDRETEQELNDAVLEADEESFPASDAPAWTGGTEDRPHYEEPPR